MGSGSDDDYNRNKDFTSLKSWQSARDVKLLFYKNIILMVPKHEEYNLIIQMKKAAVSVTANIAEGYGRYNYQECIQFLRISRGSLYELKDHLMSCFDLNYIDKDIFQTGLTLIENTKKLLNGYIRFKTKQKE